MKAVGDRVERKRHIRGLGRTFKRGNVWWVAYSHRGREIRESSTSTKITDANKLLKNAAHRDYLGSTFNVKAVEMELSGIADATWINDKAGYLAVRGLLVWADRGGRPARGAV